MEETKNVNNVTPPTAVQTTPIAPTIPPKPPVKPIDSAPNLPSQATPEKKAKKKLTKKAIYIILAVVTILSLLTAGGIYSYYEYFAPEEEEEVIEETPAEDEEEVTEEEESPEEEEEVVDLVDVGGNGIQVAYMKASNVYLVDGDASDTVQVTDDGTTMNQFYTAIGWKTENQLGYSKCDGSCEVYVYNLEDESTILEFTPPPFTQRIAAMAWSNDGGDFAYIWQKVDGSYGAMIGDDEVAQFGISPGRGGSVDDGMEVYFSPNGSKVLFLNTVGNEVDPTVILANTVDGSIITSITSATFPTFDGDLGFYFKHEGKIKHYSFASSTTSNAYDFGDGGGYNLETSPDGFFVSFWSDDSDSDSTTELIGFDVAGSPFAIRDNIANAKWYGDSNVLVGLKQEAADDDIGMFAYQTTSLVKFNRIGGAELILADGAVYEFEVEPL